MACYYIKFFHQESIIPICLIRASLTFGLSNALYSCAKNDISFSNIQFGIVLMNWGVEIWKSLEYFLMINSDGSVTCRTFMKSDNNQADNRLSKT